MEAAHHRMPRQWPASKDFVQKQPVQPIDLLPMGTGDIRPKQKMTAEDSDTLVGSEVLLPAPKQDLVEVPLPGASSNSPVSVVQSPFRPVAVIRIGTMEISLTNSVSGKLIKQIKELLPDAE